MRVFRDDNQPIRPPDIAPVAVVLLVIGMTALLISWPRATHGMFFDIEPKPPRLSKGVDLEYNTVSVDMQNQTTWKGTPIDLVTLSEFLAATRTMSPAPELRIVPAGTARYGAIAPMLAVVKRSAVPNVRFAGNAGYRKFESLTLPGQRCAAMGC
jgi:biopolymer transport protein ExbD